MSKFKMSKLILVPVTSMILLASCATQPREESTGQYLDSSVITTKVKAKLVSDDSVKSLPITVKTYKGTVMLSGFVVDESQRMNAARDARSVEGVMEVKNNLVVRRR